MFMVIYTKPTSKLLPGIITTVFRRMVYGAQAHRGHNHEPNCSNFQPRTNYMILRCTWGSRVRGILARPLFSSDG
jgi:hypothetical protein